MNEVGDTYTKSVNFIEQKTAQALRSSLSSLQGMLELFSDVKKLKAFLERVWKTISDWFLKNKKAFEKDIKKVREYLSKSRRAKYMSTKMERKYIGEETGNGWCSPNAVRYLDELERAKFELAIIDGKLYTANGKLFDTTFAGTLDEVTQKAIFVMSKEGRIYATNSYPTYQLHHSSFLAGENVAAAGEIKVIKGVIEFISKQSGHYRPSRKYMRQFMRLLKENGIDVNKIIVEF